MGFRPRRQQAVLGPAAPAAGTATAGGAAAEAAGAAALTGAAAGGAGAAAERRWGCSDYRAVEAAADRAAKHEGEIQDVDMMPRFTTVTDVLFNNLHAEH